MWFSGTILKLIEGRCSESEPTKPAMILRVKQSQSSASIINLHHTYKPLYSTPALPVVHIRLVLD